MGAEEIQIEMRRLIADLEDWAKWQHGYTLRLGYPAQSIGLSSGYVSVTFDEMCEQADNVRCSVLETMVDDLPPAQKCAIHKRYLRAVYRFPRDNYVQMLADAHAALLQAGYGKGLW